MKTFITEFFLNLDLMKMVKKFFKIWIRENVRPEIPAILTDNIRGYHVYL